VGGGAEIFELFAGEDVKSNEMDLRVAVLASLGGGHVDNLARTALDDDEAVLPQGRTLHRVGGRRAGIDRLEGVVMLQDDVSSATRNQSQRYTEKGHSAMHSMRM
jgi:hypothetical protein